ncbi:MAG: DUF4350 domain-containing protein [Planctomycetales bacterium]
MSRASLARPERPISPWLWLAVLAALVALHFWFPPVQPPGFTDSYSATGEGKKAFFRIVQAHTGRAARNLSPLSQLVNDLRRDYGESGTICLLGPARRPSPRETEALLEWVSNGGALLWAVPEDVFSQRRWSEIGSDAEDDAEDDELELIPGVRLARAKDAKPGPPTTRLAAEGLFLWKSEAVLEADEGFAVVLREGGDQAVLIEYGDGTILVAASDFIFSNQSLAWNDNSILAFRLLDEIDRGGTIHFDESLNATGGPKVVGLLLDPPLRSVTVQLLVLIAVFGWMGSRRFGPLLPESAAARQNIVDHTDAVGALRFRAGDGAGALRSYLRQLGMQLRLPAHQGREERVLDPIARRLGTETRALRQLLRQAEHAAEGDRVDRRTAAELIRRLAALRKPASTGS